MARLGLFLLVTTLALAAGCSRERTLKCEENERYSSASSVPPLRVPDDLTVPDETDALRIPDPAPAPESPADKPCLESPPDFSTGEQQG